MEGAAEGTELTQIKNADKDAEMDQKGETNLGFDLETNNEEQTKEEEPEEELPPLTYIDFLPQSFGTRMAGGDPVYATFQTVVEQANQWLTTSPQFSVVKCESVDYKLTRSPPDDLSLEPDLCLQHFSSNGRNLYVRGLRLWLMPRTNQSLPIQQLGYVTILPDHSSGNLMAALSAIKPSAMRSAPEQAFKEFDTMKVTMEKLNHRLQQKPVPGRILTVETLNFKAVETDCRMDFDTEQTFWAESGKGIRLFLFVTRLFYVVGPPAFEKVCYHDAEPDTLQNPEDFGMKVKFSPFSQTVAKTAAWLTKQTNMRAVNFQSVTIKMERPGGVGPFTTNTESPGYAESQSLQESRYVKVLRVFYAKDPQHQHQHKHHHHQQQQQQAGTHTFVVAPTPTPPAPKPTSPPPPLPIGLPTTPPLLPHQPTPPVSSQPSSPAPAPSSSSQALPPPPPTSSSLSLSSSSLSSSLSLSSPPALNKSMHLTTRLFVPTRGGGLRDFETFSKTMERVILWLKATGTPVLGMETVRYSVHPDTDQTVVSERVDSVVSTFSGQYSLACIRLYFPCEFQEPPLEVVPETQEDYWGWACVVS